MKCVKLLAVCMTLVLFCTGVVGCTDILDESPSVTTTQDAGASTTIRNTTTTSTSKPTTTTTATTTTIKKTTTTTIKKTTTTTKKVTTTTTTTKRATTTTIKTTTSTKAPNLNTETMVWIPTNGGTKYHKTSSCSKMINPEYVTLSQAKNLGFTACGRCYK